MTERERETGRGRQGEGNSPRGRQGEGDRERETGRGRQKDMDKESDTGRLESERETGIQGVRQGEEDRDLHSAKIGSKGE